MKEVLTTYLKIVIMCSVGFVFLYFPPDNSPMFIFGLQVGFSVFTIILVELWSLAEAMGKWKKIGGIDKLSEMILLGDSLNPLERYTEIKFDDEYMYYRHGETLTIIVEPPFRTEEKVFMSFYTLLTQLFFRRKIDELIMIKQTL